jgi:hypothetical protein
MKNIDQIRQDSELPSCVEKWGWKFHHPGIPTEKVMPDERYIAHLKFYVSERGQAWVTKHCQLRI